MLDFYGGISSFDVQYYVLMVDSINVCLISIRDSVELITKERKYTDGIFNFTYLISICQTDIGLYKSVMFDG